VDEKSAIHLQINSVRRRTINSWCLSQPRQSEPNPRAGS
jgi:hypothetical protein